MATTIVLTFLTQALFYVMKLLMLIGRGFYNQLTSGYVFYLLIIIIGILLVNLGRETLNIPRNAYVVWRGRHRLTPGERGWLWMSLFRWLSAAEFQAVYLFVFLTVFWFCVWNLFFLSSALFLLAGTYGIVWFLFVFRRYIVFLHDAACVIAQFLVETHAMSTRAVYVIVAVPVYVARWLAMVARIIHLRVPPTPWPMLSDDRPPAGVVSQVMVALREEDRARVVRRPLFYRLTATAEPDLIQRMRLFRVSRQLWVAARLSELGESPLLRGDRGANPVLLANQLTAPEVTPEEFEPDPFLYDADDEDAGPAFVAASLSSEAPFDVMMERSFHAMQLRRVHVQLMERLGQPLQIPSAEAVVWWLLFRHTVPPPPQHPDEFEVHSVSWETETATSRSPPPLTPQSDDFCIAADCDPATEEGGLEHLLAGLLVRTEALGAGKTDLLRLLGMLVSITRSKFDPVVAAGVFLSAYPDVCVRIMTQMLGQRLGDLRTSLIEVLTSGSEGPEIEAVIAADSEPPDMPDPASGLFKAIRREFAWRLLLDHFVDGWIGVQVPFLRDMAKRYATTIAGGVQGFIEGLVNSLFRIVAHVRYYIDGDLPAYLKALDPEGAALYRYAMLEVHYNEFGFDDRLLQRLECEIPAVKALLPKVMVGSRNHKSIVDMLRTMETWRQQCHNRNATGRLPFTLNVSGPTRCGKSEWTETLVGMVAKFKRVPVAEVQVARPRASDKYETELKPGTEVVLYQDSLRAAEYEDRKEILNQIFDLAGGQSLPLTHAALEEKGQYMAPPKLIALTSNEPTMVYDDGHILQDPSAFAARLRYGVFVTWDSDEYSDPHRSQVRWSFGRFNPDAFKNNKFPYDFAAEPWCGEKLTIPELNKRVYEAFVAHQKKNDDFDRLRGDRAAQCRSCYGLGSMCECPSGPATGGEWAGAVVAADFSVDVSVGFLPWPVSWLLVVWLANVVFNALLYQSVRVFALMKLWSFADWLFVWLSARAPGFTRWERKAYKQVCEHAKAARQMGLSAKAQIDRLNIMRARGAIVIVVAGAVATCMAMYWAWRQKRGEQEADAASGLTEAPRLPQPGIPVRDADLMLPERSCGRWGVVGSGHVNFVRLDGHSLLSVSHIAPSLGIVKPVQWTHTGGISLRSFAGTLYPEACTVDRARDMLVACVNTRLPERAGWEVPTFAPLPDGALQLWVSGVSGDTGMVHRYEVTHLSRPVVPFPYRDHRDGHVFEIPVGECALVDGPFGAGCCGSVLHDGVRVYGIAVAVDSKRCAIRLIRSAEWLHAGGVAPVPGVAPTPVTAFVARGMDPCSQHPRSPFQGGAYPNVDYLFSVVDGSHVKARSRRVLGPDAEDFAALTGVPVASVAEATGAAGFVEGVDHRVSPMEHAMNKHRLAQAREAPELERDWTPLVEFLREVVDEVPLTYKEPISTDVALLGDGVIRGVALDKSAGFPTGPKSQFMERDASGAWVVPAALRLAVDSRFDRLVGVGEVDAPIYRPFPKQGELLNPAKVEAGNTRVIMNHLGFVYAVAVRRLMLPVLLNIVAARATFGILVGLSATDPVQVRALRSELHIGRDPADDGDHEGFDLAMRFRVALVALTIVVWVARRMGYDTAKLRAVRAVAFSWLFPYMVYRGDVYQPPGNWWGSGTLGTEVFQSLCSWLLHMIANMAWLRTAVGKDSGATMRSLHRAQTVRVYGDDNIRVHCGPGPTGADIARTMGECGYKLTDASDKSLPPCATFDPSILKRRFRLVRYGADEMYTLALEPKSIVKSLYYPKKGPDGRMDREIYKQCLVNATAEAFLHGPDFFEPFRAIASKALSNLGAPEPPTADQLKGRYLASQLETWDGGGQFVAAAAEHPWVW